MNVYTFRICAAIGNGEPIELFRARRSFSWADLRFWSRDMSPEWAIWVERPMPNKKCITDRPKINAPHVYVNAEKLRLYEKP